MMKTYLIIKTLQMFLSKFLLKIKQDCAWMFWYRSINLVEKEKKLEIINMKCFNLIWIKILLILCWIIGCLLLDLHLFVLSLIEFKKTSLETHRILWNLQESWLIRNSNVGKIMIWLIKNRYRSHRKRVNKL